MKTNHQMNYYDYGKNLDIQGIMPVIVGGGLNPDTHEYVDLGLPSGTLWAKCNIGANTQYEPGDYFAWGEVNGYNYSENMGFSLHTIGDKAYSIINPKSNDTFNNNDYRWGTSDTGLTNQGMTKYNNSDSKNTLDPEDDAATVNWGNEWCIPTEEQLRELFINENENLYRGWDDERHGYVISGTNGNELFFFGGGHGSNGIVSYYADRLSYMANSTPLDDSCDICISLYVAEFFDNQYLVNIGRNSRYYGYSVRPVRL